LLNAAWRMAVCMSTSGRHHMVGKGVAITESEVGAAARGERDGVRALRAALEGFEAAATDVAHARGACDVCRAAASFGVVCNTCARVWHGPCAPAGERADPFAIGWAGMRCPPCAQGRPGPPAQQRLVRERVERMEYDEAWEAVQTALDRGPPRRRLAPRSATGFPSYSSELFAAVIRVLVEMTEAGDTTAELLLVFAPRLFAPKGRSVADAVDDFIGKRDVSEVKWKAATEGQALAGRVGAALIDGRPGRVVRALDGRRSRPADADEIARLFPAQAGIDDVERLWALKSRLRTRDTATGTSARFTPNDMRRWAMGHQSSSGGACGWSGGLLAQLAQIDKTTTDSLAVLWARPPSEWHVKQTAEFCFRELDGWIIGGDKRRPIAAPQVMRKIGAAVAVHACRPLVRRYCEDRGQYGMSGEAEQLAYSLTATIAVAAGGTVLVADRSNSFQTINRNAVLDALEDLISTCRDQDCGMAHRLLDAVEDYWIDGPLRRSNVNFSEMDDKVDVGGLPQGCALSGLLEAVVLAWNAGDDRAAPSTAATDTYASHDDVRVVGFPDARVDDFALPDCGRVGGEYNSAKSKAVGVLATELVQCGFAVEATSHVTVWGRPVGDVYGWVRDVFVPKVRARIAKLRELADVDIHTAIKAAMLLGGPGDMAVHFLKGLPPALTDDAMMAVELAVVDAEWRDMMVGLAGGVGGRDADTAVYCTLRHKRAGEYRELAAWTGVCTAWGAMRRMHTRYDDALEAAVGGTETDAQEVRKQRLEAMPEPPAFTLWRAALGPRNSLHDVISAGGMMAQQDLAVRLALRRAMGLTCVPTMNGRNLVPLGRCTLCGAVWDEDHIAKCRRLPVSANNKRRHDALAMILARIAVQCGFDASPHDGPLFDKPGGKRPADWLERDAMRHIHVMGLCQDLTIRTGGLAAVTAATKAKERKYAQFLQHDKRYGLAIFGITTDGQLHKDAVETLNRYATRLAAMRRKLAEPIRQPHTDVRNAVGAAFAAVMAGQMLGYARETVERMAPLSLVAKRRRRPDAGIEWKRRHVDGVARPGRNAWIETHADGTINSHGGMTP